jgi:hypothetical protein
MTKLGCRRRCDIQLSSVLVFQLDSPISSKHDVFSRPDKNPVLSPRICAKDITHL